MEDERERNPLNSFEILSKYICFQILSLFLWWETYCTERFSSFSISTRVDMNCGLGQRERARERERERVLMALQFSSTSLISSLLRQRHHLCPPLSASVCSFTPWLVFLKLSSPPKWSFCYAGQIYSTSENHLVFLLLTNEKCELGAPAEPAENTAVVCSRCGCRKTNTHSHTHTLTGELHRVFFEAQPWNAKDILKQPLERCCDREGNMKPQLIL